jgi:ATP-binding cassette subfamily F protein 3
MIQITNVSKSYGTQVLFENITVTLGRGERVGFVGRNGTGKSTLFKLLLREESEDAGDITFPKNYKVGTLKQHLHFTEPTILAECLLAIKEDERDWGQYKVEKMLHGLGFKTSDFPRPPSDFSGGYQIRLNLAKVLLSEPNCLLLDEPTNYLDIVSMRWLTRFLREFEGEMMLITHDRGFMDEVTTHTMGLWRQKLMKIPGSSQKYFEQIILEEEIYEKTRLNSDKKRKELEEFVARFKAKASKAAQAQSRMKLLEKMPEMESLGLISSLEFEFNHKECPGKVLMEVKDVAFGYTDLLFKDLTFPILKGDKIAIIGKNGKGKSTLLNVLAGELQPKRGEVSRNVNLLMGHFGQTNINRLSLENSVEDEIASADPGLPMQRVRSICGTMMFSGDLAKKKIKVLSGGERSRVLLGKLLARPTNLLLLDEPTNHLDQESVESLTMELQTYPGAVIIVTHSEGMLRDVAKSLVVFHHNKVEFLRENYDDFLKKIGWEEEEEDDEAPPVVEEKISYQEAKRLRAEAVIERSRALAPMKKKMEILEKDIMKLEIEQMELEKDLIDLSAGGSSGNFQEKSLRLGIVKKKVDESFEQLTSITLQHDEIFNGYEAKLKALET